MSGRENEWEGRWRKRMGVCERNWTKWKEVGYVKNEVEGDGNREKSRALRGRKAEDGGFELRGIWREAEI